MRTITARFTELSAMPVPEAPVAFADPGNIGFAYVMNQLNREIWPQISKNAGKVCKSSRVVGFPIRENRSNGSFLRYLKLFFPLFKIQTKESS